MVLCFGFANQHGIVLIMQGYSLLLLSSTCMASSPFLFYPIAPESKLVVYKE